MTAPNFRVRLQRNVLEYLTIAAIEAYCEGRGRKNAKRNYVETLGYLWGVQKHRDGTVYCVVDKSIVSVSALRAPASVEPNSGAAALMNAIVSRWSPHLTLVGDFHSQPYDSLDDVKNNKGWNYSDQDKDAFLADELLWSQTSNPLMLVIAVCPLQRVRTTVFDNPQWNVIRYAIGEFQFWISAAVGYESDRGERCVTPNNRSSVELHADVGERNLSSERLAK